MLVDNNLSKYNIILLILKYLKLRTLLSDLKKKLCKDTDDIITK